MRTSNLPRGYTTALLSAMVLSTTSVIIRYLTQTHEMPALVLAFWRDLFAGLTLLIGLTIFSPKQLIVRRSQLAYLALFGVIFAFFNSFWTLSVSINGASVATVLAYCSPAFSAILGVWLLKDKPDRVRIGAIIVCLAGCVLVVGAYDPQVWGINLAGIITGLLTGVTYAIYTLMGRMSAQRGISPWTSLTYIFWFAAFTLLVFNLLPGGFLPGAGSTLTGMMPRLNYAGWGALLFLAAVPTVLGFVLFNISLVYLSPNLTNLILTSEPVFTSIIAFFLLGEILAGWQIAGTVLILSAVVFLRLHEGRKEKMALLSLKQDPTETNLSLEKQRAGKI